MHAPLVDLTTLLQNFAVTCREFRAQALGAAGDARAAAASYAAGGDDSPGNRAAAATARAAAEAHEAEAGEWAERERAARADGVLLVLATGKPMRQLGPAYSALEQAAREQNRVRYGAYTRDDGDRRPGNF